MIPVALGTIAKTGKQLKCKRTDECIKKMGYLYNTYTYTILYNTILIQYSVQFSHSVVSNSLRPHASLSNTSFRSLLKLMFIESVLPSSHLILCHPLLLLPPIPPSITVFSNESTLHMRCPKYWSFDFNISPSNEHPGLISFRMDWLDLLAVQGTLKSLLQHHVQKHQFFGIQLSL